MSTDGKDKPEARGLARSIAKAGYATRRQAEEMVRSGRVRVDGKRCLDPYRAVATEQEIVIDGVEMTEIIRAYYAFHKPESVSTHPTRHHSRLLGDFLPRDVPGIRPAGRAPVREGADVLAADGEPIGVVTSGGFGGTLNAPVAMGYVNAAHAQPGTAIQVSGRRGPEPAEIAALPFVPHRYFR